VDGWEDLAELYLTLGFDRLNSRLPD
jgi:hypothetical protein